jgi:hypothetical protein
MFFLDFRKRDAVSDVESSSGDFWHEIKNRSFGNSINSGNFSFGSDIE